MSHEVENMFYVGETPWHKLGTKIVDPPRLRQVWELSFPWGVEMRPLYMKKTMNPSDFVREADELDEVVCKEHDNDDIARMAYKHAENQFVEVNSYACVRNTDEKVLGVHGLGWTPLQPIEMVEKLRPLWENKQIEFETGGSLRGGKHIWLLAKIVDNYMAEIIPNDPVCKHLLFAQGFDGSLSAVIGFVPIRVVCANTLAAALESGGAKTLRAYHTKNVSTTIDKIMDVVDIANRRFTASVEQWQELAKRSINDEDLEKYVKVVFGRKCKTADTQLSDDLRVKRIFEDSILPNFEGGRGSEIPGVRGTWWGAYNSVSEYLTHQRGRSEEARLDSLMNGQGGMYNRKAMTTAADMALV